MGNGIDVLRQKLGDLKTSHQILKNGSTMAAVGAIGMAVTTHSPEIVLGLGALAAVGDVTRRGVSDKIEDIERYLTNHH